MGTISSRDQREAAWKVGKESCASEGLFYFGEQRIESEPGDAELFEGGSRFPSSGLYCSYLGEHHLSYGHCDYGASGALCMEKEDWQTKAIRNITKKINTMDAKINRMK